MAAPQEARHVPLRRVRQAVQQQGQHAAPQGAARHGARRLLLRRLLAALLVEEQPGAPQAGHARNPRGPAGQGGRRRGLPGPRVMAPGVPGATRNGERTTTAAAFEVSSQQTECSAGFGAKGPSAASCNLVPL